MGEKTRSTHWQQILDVSGLILFSLCLYLLDDYLTGLMQAHHLAWMFRDEYRTDRSSLAVITLLYLFIVWVIYCWASFRAAKPVRIILCAFFVLSVFIEYGYFSTFNRWMTSVDLWTAALSPWSLWTEAIGMYFNKSALLMAAIFTAAVALNWRKPRSKTLPEVILLVCLIGTWVYRTYLPFDRIVGSSVFQYTHLLEDIRPADRLFGSRIDVPQISTSRPANNIILVIDESLRGDHLSINGYGRDTTPTLQKLKDEGLVTNWGIAVASATCSVFSNPHILTGVPSTPGTDNRLTSHWPTIFQYARAMGYKTYYLDAQANYLWNGLLTSDLTYVDVHMTTDDFTATMHSDKNAAMYIRQLITDTTGNFIVLNKMGMHILYENNYPPSEAHWLPTPPDRDYKHNPTLVINAYDNALHYNLETFFQTLMPDLKELPNTLIVYTSDHGDTLQEHGETWSHCHNTDPEATVPLFIVGKLDHSVDTGYSASHVNIMPTILDLMQVPESKRSQTYAPSLLSAQASLGEKRYFIDGDLQSVQYKSRSQ